MMALTQVPSLSLTNLHQLVEEMGSASAVYENRKDLRELLAAASQQTLDALVAMDSHLGRAEQELAFCQKGGLKCLGINDETYPQRLKDCSDAPVLLYYRGSADLNARHIISIRPPLPA